MKPNLLNELEWVLSIGIGKAYKSTSGSTYERAMCHRFDSNNKRIPLARGLVSKYDSAGKLVEHYDRSAVMKLNPPEEEAAYEMEFRDLFRIGRVTRALTKIQREDPQSCSVLSAIYGDTGARWGQTQFGRDVAIYPMTKTGSVLIEGIRERFPLSHEIRDDELLVQDLHDQNRAPNDIRRRKHAKMRLEADALKTAAHRAWEQAIG